MPNDKVLKCPDPNRIKTTKKINFKKLKISLKFRPNVYKLIIKLYRSVRKKGIIIKKLKKQLAEIVNKTSNGEASQTNESHSKVEDLKSEPVSTWKLDAGDNEKSIAEQVKEAAQSALDQNGMVYVESAGMYYDYKTGYYYNADLGLYYHNDTKCYYYYSEEKNNFVFHSYPDSTKISREEKAHEQFKKKQAKKHKKDNEDTEAKGDEPIEPKPKHKKRENKKERNALKEKYSISINPEKEQINISDETVIDNKIENKMDCEENIDLNGVVNKEQKADLEDGECSESGSESSSEEGNCSTTTASDDEEWVSNHHPPCMRVIVKETKLAKLKVGTLFLVTKDGGSIGREGDHHIILLKDINVSRKHMEIMYDSTRKCYAAVDLGSKNGSILNGHRMSESNQTSSVMAIPHGSVLELGETKLLCHIHPGTNTCGHCEPGLIMEEESKKQIAYTRTCSVQQQYQLELCRLKNKYGPELLAIEEGAYVDRAKQRRETVGSTHSSEKTQQADLDTSITQENKGFKMLEKMGWSKGEGLGKDSQGETEPVPLVNNDTKAGLGAPGSKVSVTVPAAGPSQMKFVKKGKPLRPPAKAFLDPLEDEDD